MNKRPFRTNGTKEIDGFLCCKIQPEPQKPKEPNEHKELPKDLESFLKGLNGKKQH
jgi:hypothetical protein